MRIESLLMLVMLVSLLAFLADTEPTAAEGAHGVTTAAGPGQFGKQSGAVPAIRVGCATSVDFIDPALEGIPYRHPLINAAKEGKAVSSLYPAADSEGVSYGIEEGISVDETGNEVNFSGVVAHPMRKLTEAERKQRTKQKQALYGSPPSAPPPPRKIGESLEALLDKGNQDQRVQVIIAVDRSGDIPLYEQVQQAIAAGKVLTQADYVRVRRNLIQARTALIARRLKPVADAVRGVGGFVNSECEQLHLLTATVPLNGVHALTQQDTVLRIDENLPEEPEVDGRHVILAHQIKQFIDAGYDGQKVGPNRHIIFAQVERRAADDEHAGFKDGSGNTIRIVRRCSCDGSSCLQKNNFPPGDESMHATSVAGLIFGDLRDGQDGTANRIARSGYAGESRGWLYKSGFSKSAFCDIASASQTMRPVVVNMSAGSVSADPNCRGRNATSRAANELFESGTLVIKSAGNEENDTLADDCTVTSPGSAIGVFTVASLGSSSENGNTQTARKALISSFSSRGGTKSQGKRSIIDLAAYGCRKQMFSRTGGYRTDNPCGTSYAAPTVTATAIDFIDFYKDKFDDAIDDPGILFTALLLMGDRKSQKSATSKKLSRFDNRYGAGRLRARKFDKKGMDKPWGFKFGHRCVGRNEEVTIKIKNGKRLPNSVDVFKAVIWWYDQRHEVNGKLDDTDLYLEEKQGGQWKTVRSSISYTDNKERVFETGVGGKRLRLQIDGYKVTADATGCGTNKMKVYYGYFYEDSARDDPDGPGNEISKE